MEHKMTQDKKGDQIIWWLMITFASIITLGGAAWATSINSKVEKIATLEVNIQYIQTDVSTIKEMIQLAIRNQGGLNGKPGI
jgi:hypothetical protein